MKQLVTSPPLSRTESDELMYTDLRSHLHPVHEMLPPVFMVCLPTPIGIIMIALTPHKHMDTDTHMDKDRHQHSQMPVPQLILGCIKLTTAHS